jgi:hypothetical protein
MTALKHLLARLSTKLRPHRREAEQVHRIPSLTIWLQSLNAGETTPEAFRELWSDAYVPPADSKADSTSS